jgi:ribosomal protein L44E
MAEHYTKNTKAVSKWCPTCDKSTMHRVDFKRIGPCTEHEAPSLSKEQEKRQAAQEKAEREPGLF